MPAKRKRAPGAGRPKGPPKKKIGLNLLVESCAWLDRQPDKSAAVDGLIAEAARGQKHASPPPTRNRSPTSTARPMPITIDRKFVKSHVPQFAKFIAGDTSATELRQMWLDYRQRILENRRFDNWCRKNRVKWDEQAHAYALTPATP